MIWRRSRAAPDAPAGSRSHVPAPAYRDAQRDGQPQLAHSPIEPKEEVTSAFTRDEVADPVEHSSQSGMLQAGEVHLLTGALTFDQRHAGQVMLPVADLVTVAATVTPREVEELAARTGFSRFPVRDGDGDLARYLHLKDVIDLPPEDRDAAVHSAWLRPMARVDSEDTLAEVLRTMQEQGSHLARVGNPEGSLVGVTALEDVLQELVGEIRDEPKPHDPLV